MREKFEIEMGMEFFGEYRKSERVGEKEEMKREGTNSEIERRKDGCQSINLRNDVMINLINYCQFFDNISSFFVVPNRIKFYYLPRSETGGRESGFGSCQPENFE